MGWSEAGAWPASHPCAPDKLFLLLEWARLPKAARWCWAPGISVCSPGLPGRSLDYGARSPGPCRVIACPLRAFGPSMTQAWMPSLMSPAVSACVLSSSRKSQLGSWSLNSFHTPPPPAHATVYIVLTTCNAHHPCLCFSKFYPCSKAHLGYCIPHRAFLILSAQGTSAGNGVRPGNLTTIIPTLQSCSPGPCLWE